MAENVLQFKAFMIFMGMMTAASLIIGALIR